MQSTKTCFCSLLFCFILQYANAQQTKLNWLATANGYLNGGFLFVEGIAEYADKSVIVVGRFEETADFDPGPDTSNLKAVSAQDIFIAKYTSTGKLVFAYSFGGASNLLNESANAVVLDKQGNAYITGTFGKDIDFDPGVGKTILSAPYANEVFLLSLNSEGKFRYASSIAENNQNDQIRQIGKSIAVDDEGSIFLTGTFSGKNIDFDPGTNKVLFTSQGQDIFLAKYDKTGKYIFNKVIGGNDVDEVNKLQLDHDNNILICGYFKSYYNDFDPGFDSAQLMLHGRQDIYFAKYDKNGNYVFAKSIGGTKYDEAISLAVATDNSFIVTGSFQNKNVDFDPGPGIHILNSVYGSDLFFARYDLNGNYIYAYNLAINNYEEVYDIAIKKNNNFTIVGGSYNSEIDFDPDPDSTHYVTGFGNQFFAEYSLTGNLLNVSTLASYETETNRFLINDEGEYILAGKCYGELDTLVANDSSDGGYTTKPHNFFVSRLDKNAHHISSFTSDNYNYPGSIGAGVTAMAKDESGNTYTCGYLSGRYDFDPGPGTYILAPGGNLPYISHGYFAKYDKNGKIVFAKLLVSTSIQNIAIDKNQNIFLVGTAGYRSDFDPSDSVFTLPLGYGGYFIAKYNAGGNLIFAKGETVSGSGVNFKYIEIDTSNNLRIAGHLSGTIDFDPSASFKKVKSIGNYDIFFATYTTNGKLVYVKHVGGVNSSCVPNGFKLLSNNSYVMAGTMYGDIDFDPGPGEKIISGKETSCYVASYSAKGDLLYAFGLSRINNDFGQEVTTMTVDSSDNIYVAGNFGGKVDFDPGTDTFAIYTNTYDNFITCYTGDGSFKYARNIKLFNQAYFNTIYTMATDKFNNLYAALSFESQAVNVNTEEEPVIVKNESYGGFSNHNSEMLIAAYDSLGNYRANYNYNSDSAAGSNFINSLAVEDNRLVVGCTLSSKIDFDMTQDTVYFTPVKNGNFCLASYSLVGNDKPLKDKIPIAKTTNTYIFDEKYRSLNSVR